MPYTTINAVGVPPAPPQTWSNMKVFNGHFTIAGMVADGSSTYSQAKNVFVYIKSLVEAAGGSMADIMTMQIFVTNLDENQEIWRARREFFEGDFPCSTLIEVKRVGSPTANPPAKVEINCSGFLNASNKSTSD